MITILRVFLEEELSESLPILTFKGYERFFYIYLLFYLFIYLFIYFLVCILPKYGQI